MFLLLVFFFVVDIVATCVAVDVAATCVVNFAVVDAAIDATCGVVF
jgi:hypothetical protein